MCVTLSKCDLGTSAHVDESRQSAGPFHRKFAVDREIFLLLETCPTLMDNICREFEEIAVVKLRPTSGRPVIEAAFTPHQQV